MIIYQKNFNNNTFDPLKFYQQKQAENAVSKGVSREGDGYINSEQGVDTYKGFQPGVSLMDKDSNSTIVNATITARRQYAGLDGGKPEDKNNSGWAKTQQAIQNQTNKAKEAPATSSKSSYPSFDEAKLREQFKNQGMSADQIEDSIASAKQSYDAELAAKASATKPAEISDVMNPVEQPTVPNKPLAKPIKDVEIISDTDFEEAPLPARTLGEELKTKAQVATTNAKKSIGEGIDKVSDKLSELSSNYGEGITGSLGGDAALAAGGLALAGGAYHLLKKRMEKKKAEKEAVKNKFKK